MILDQATNVEHLRAVQARHPDTTTDLEPLNRALSDPTRRRHGDHTPPTHTH